MTEYWDDPAWVDARERMLRKPMPGESAHAVFAREVKAIVDTYEISKRHEAQEEGEERRMTDATKRVLKWVVPVNDETAMIGAGDVVHVDCQNGPDFVMVWTEEFGHHFAQDREVQVFGTGHQIPMFATHLGSVMAEKGALVWHVYELPKVADTIAAPEIQRDEEVRP